MNLPSKYHLSFSYENEIRRLTVNNNTRINEIIKRSIEIFDLNINDIAGIFFFFIDFFH